MWRKNSNPIKERRKQLKEKLQKEIESDEQIRVSVRMCKECEKNVWYEVWGKDDIRFRGACWCENKSHIQTRKSSLDEMVTSLMNNPLYSKF